MYNKCYIVMIYKLCSIVDNVLSNIIEKIWGVDLIILIYFIYIYKYLNILFEYLFILNLNIFIGI